ncbi:MAG: ABC transporter substrate-binding protein [Bauldia sp.]|uniref:ABC transporter substrate-binding protein n=1 Tax=Bauldia sp. TaxID=2575872 RepID=UPI001D1F4062|nr:ABC transporter substrate-binding protein [Bauldia sp.]MCB1486044.1 ABC transporter substrate-binding protein [Bauldia sp.]MCB1494444.1 ABC transporter substrate-binding protein [Bauldia sp.]
MRVVSVSAAALAGGASIAEAQSYDLIQAARDEGTLTTIALPHDWCGYGGIIEAFTDKYGIEVHETQPEASSAEQLEAIRASAGDAGADTPDVVDIGLSFAGPARDEGLLAPFKVGSWDTIPEEVKDVEGYWYGDYYGVIAFEVNADIVKEIPEDWPDLLDAAYKGAVALSGDPRSSAQAAQSVYAAGLAADADADGAAIGKAGVQFFADLNAAGNFVPEAGTAASLIAGKTPIVIRWDYVGLADRDSVEEPRIEVVVPKSGVVARPYVQAISAHAPHPNAARLWMEYLYSDDGQLGWLKGGCHPIRFDDLVKYKKIPEALAATMPPADAYADVVFPSIEDQGAANQTTAEEWETMVGAGVN